MLFYKVLILFWGCTRTCSHAWWFIIFHIIYIITIPFSPAWPKHYLPVGGSVGVGELKVLHDNAGHKTELHSQMLIYQTLYAR